jgi:hypothetical protein
MSGVRAKAINLLVITLVAGLLWLWAAGQTRESDDVQVAVRFVSSQPDASLVVPSEPITVQLELRGARRELDRATDRLSGATLNLRTGRSGVPAAAGTYTIDVVTALSREEKINETGVAIVSATPASIVLEVLETATVEAKVVPVVPSVQLAGEATAQPATVAVTLPKSLVPSLGAEPRVEAFVAASQVANRDPGRWHTVEATLRVAEGLESQAKLIRFAPERVNVNINLASRLRTAVLRIVPVQISGPPADLDGFTVSLDPGDEFLRDVEVSGPAETIQALEAGRAKAIAFVHLSGDDLARRITRQRVGLWLLPPGVTVTRVGAETIESDTPGPPVRLRIADRATPRK